MVIKTPPMGWNTWNTFGADINEELVLSAADALVNTGLKAAGYNYVVIDDCWAMRERGKDGLLTPDPDKFPHGMKYIADYIHSKGLKFGMYSCNGTMTCAAYPASYNREFLDAKTFAGWDIDFLKYDNCFHPASKDIRHLYRRMGLALANCGRDILYSACSWGMDNTHEWIGTTGAHMWRSTGDIFDHWSSIKALIMAQYDLLPYTKHGCFNDMDMLIVGMNGKGNVGINACTEEEYKTHFAAWCLFSSPLMIGCDVRNMDDGTKKILLNADLIKICQDKRGNQPFKVEFFYPEMPVIARILDNGDIAIGVFNLTDGPINHSFCLEDLDIPFEQGKTLVGKELYTGEKTVFENETLYIKNLPAHACKIYRFKVTDL